MKRFFRKLGFFSLFFSLFFVLINTIYLGIIGITDWDFRKRLESITFENPDFELLVFGNSLPEYGIDTELLNSKGIKSYNMAMIGNSNETCFIQLNEYLNICLKKPRYILYCIDSWSESFYNEGIHPIVEFSMEDHHYDINDIPIAKFRWFGVEVLKKIVSSNHRKTRISYGQVKSPKVIIDDSEYKDVYIDIQAIESAHWIGEITKLCNQNDIEIIIIEMPGIKETQNLSSIGPFTLHLKNGHSTVLYNFNSQDFCKIFNTKIDWCGMSHLSQFGATNFTIEIININPFRIVYPDLIINP